MSKISVYWYFDTNKLDRTDGSGVWTEDAPAFLLQPPEMLAVPSPSDVDILDDNHSGYLHGDGALPHGNYVRRNFTGIVFPAGSNVQDLKAHGATLYLTSWDFFGGQVVAVSLDGGLTWNRNAAVEAFFPPGSGNSNFFGAWLTGPKNVWLVTNESNKIRAASFDGTTWTMHNVDTTGNYFGAIYVFTSGPKDVYVGGGSAANSPLGVFHSADKGATWQFQAFPITPSAVNPGSLGGIVGSATNLWALTGGVAPGDVGHVFYSTGNGVWVEKSPVWDVADTFVNFIWAGGGHVFVTTDGHLYHRTPDGTWTKERVATVNSANVWGFAYPIDGAVAIAVNTVEVTFEDPPLAVSPVGTGDALNPASWAVSRPDIGQQFTVMTVVQKSPTVFDVVIYERFASQAISHLVDASGVFTPSGDPIAAPATFTFAGVLSDKVDTEEHRAAAQQIVVTDIANPPTPGDLSSIGGVRIINAAGDYASESGGALLKKLILRRLATKPGEFYHLPDYGIGLGVKEVLPVKDLRALKKRIETQVLEEPEIDSVQVVIESITGDSIIEISIEATMKNSTDPVTVKVQKTPTGLSVVET